MKRPKSPGNDLEQGERINRLELALMSGQMNRRTFLKVMAGLGLSMTAAGLLANRAEAINANQKRLAENLSGHYDYIVCGAGSSGAVVARRLAENPDVRVLLLEAGGNDDLPNITEPAQWPTNLGTERDWGFMSEPNAALDGRVLPLSMGRVIGGGSSINVMAYVRGHRNDYDGWAQAAGDDAWSYAHILEIYKRIEDWQGPDDPDYRGKGGLFHVQSAPDPNPIAPAMVKAADGIGIPAYDDHNGAMMEGAGGCAIANVAIKDGRRQSVAACYLHPWLDQPNLTLLTGAHVQRVVLEGRRAVGIEFIWQDQRRRIRAGNEVILSMGAINTPKVLMLSGIGDQSELSRHGIRTVQHLPGVGRNFQDHILVGGCIWEYPEGRAQPPRNNLAECTFFWKSDASLPTPDLQPFQIEVPFTNDVTARYFDMPESGWTIAPGLVRPESRGRIQLRSANPDEAPVIHSDFLSDPQDMRALVRAVELCREIGNAPEMREFVKREIMPGRLRGRALEDFIRDASGTYWHQTCTAKMGRDEQSVVDGQLRVRGIDGLRVADGSIMPTVTTGTTMMPCVIIGARMAEILQQA
ncbi:MAG: GMC family oxidoreductase N-terminal domain-containing protein [Ectothiorhodospiraceae bacterium]|nr:GMC family oxidoreductase N-terminal domain-containing protein [Ectothiorhodospiraceae bacterium]